MRIAGILFAACLFTLPSSTVTARQWFAAGLGGGSSGFAIGAGYSLTAGLIVFSARSLSTYSSGFAGLDREEQDIGILVGILTDNSDGELLSAAIGIGYVDGVKRETLSEVTIFGNAREVEDPFNGPAVLLQVEAYSTARIGLLGYGNLNSHESFGGVLLVWRFGRVR